MSKKRTYKQPLGFDNPILNITLISLVAILLFFSIRMQKQNEIGQMRINIEAIDGTKYLITPKEVAKILKDRIGYDLDRSVVQELDMKGLEAMLNHDERIASCEMYLDKHFNINIDIAQKNPVVRVEQQNGESYYLDANGAFISTRVNGAVRVPVATGYLSAFSHDFTNITSNNLNGVLEVANHVEDDPFLHALVEQIYVKENGEIVVIPKLGRQRILLGQADDLEDKFNKLKVYYKRVVPKEGLDRFPELNLKYKDRIFGITEES